MCAQDTSREGRRGAASAASWALASPDVSSNSVAGFHINLLISTLYYLFPINYISLTP